MGRVLRVDLSKNKAVVHNLSNVLARKFIGGRGLNSKILYDEVTPSVDAFSPDNLLIFGVGPLNGTLSPSSSRWTVTAKSPLTGILGDANAGGRFGAEIKYAGLDQIIIRGRARRPVYLWIDDEDVEIRDAGNIWGKTTGDTEKALKEDVGDREVQVACIGPAGENLVRFACVISNLHRAAGRTGMGAVMGSKNLKAIAIRGSKDVGVAKPEAFERAVLEAHRKIREDQLYPSFSAYGTPILVNLLNQSGCLTTKNGETEFFAEAQKISGETFKEKHAPTSLGCFGCIIHCGHYFAEENCGQGKLEFVHLCAFGSYCLNSNMKSILKATAISDQLGVDAYSMGSIIGFAMECYEKGVLTKKETDGLELEWGNQDAIIELIKLVAHRKGLGGVLAEGVKRAAEKIGEGAAEAAQHAKGLEALDRNGPKKAWALGYATSTRGFDHLRGMQNFEGGSYGDELRRQMAIETFGTPAVMDMLTIEGKPQLMKWHQDLLAVVDSLETCKFNCVVCYGLGPEELANLFSTVTGWTINGKELLKMGERIYNLERMFNVREGITREDDTLPSKMFKPVASGPTKGLRHTRDELNKMLDEYYELRGWDKKTGIPTKQTIKQHFG